MRGSYTVVPLVIINHLCDKVAGNIIVQTQKQKTSSLLNFTTLRILWWRLWNEVFRISTTLDLLLKIRSFDLTKYVTVCAEIPCNLQESTTLKGKSDEIHFGCGSVSNNNL